MEKKITKIEKFEMIKKVLESANADQMLVELCDKEIEIIQNKYDNNKMKKDNKQKEKYEPLEKAVLEIFKQKEIVFNNDINIEDMSTSMKTTIIKRLMNKNLVKKLEKKKAKDPVSYTLVKVENEE